MESEEAGNHMSNALQKGQGPALWNSSIVVVCRDEPDAASLRVVGVRLRQRPGQVAARRGFLAGPG